MPGPRRLLTVCGLAVACLLLVRVALGQELQEVQRADGTTIKVPADVPPHVLERIRSGSGPPRSGPEPGKPDEKEEDKAEKGEEGKGGDEKKEEGKDEKDKKKEGEKAEEKPEPIKRESTPPQPPDPKELEVQPDEKGMVEFNFVGQKWLGVLDWLARISNMSLDWQELPGDYLNLTTQRPYTVRETRDLINRHLLARGYTLLSQREVLSVAKIEKLDPGMVPRVSPEELSERDPYEYVKVSFPLEWLLAETAVEELKPMLSPNGKLIALKATNRLEAMDAVTNLRDVYRVLKEEQSGTGQERLVKVFPLQYTLAEKVLEQLQELLGIEQKRGGPTPPMSPDQIRAQQEAMRQAAEQAKQGKGGPPSKEKPEIYLVANKRENSIVAVAPPDKMAIIEQAVKALDVPSDHAHSLLRNMERMQVYRLESIEPKSLITTLEELGDLDFDTRLEADDENNAIIAYASLADHITIRSLVEKLDGGGRRAEVIQLTRLRAESVAKIIDFMMGGGKEDEEETSRSSRSYFPWFSPYRSSSRRGSDEHEDQFRVDADVKNNALLLWCNDFELAKVQDLLKRLEENQREGVDPNTVEIYRLVTLDPEPFVQTLEEMETLGFQARLEVDEENNSIIAYGSKEDHAKIRELIEQLDGSGRTFHLFQLRRLEADYVAGTIAFMMAGKEEQQQSGYSRTYVYNEYYGGFPSRGGGKEKKPDEFRVEADVEFNRLLLWANEIEMEEVKNLLAKLGEIPPEGGDTSTIRVLDVLPGPEQERLLERIRRIWPSLAPNTLLTPPPEESEEKEQKEQKKTDEKGSEEEKAQSESRPATAAGAVITPALRQLDDPKTSSTAVASEQPHAAFFRFAQLQQGSTEPASSQASEEAPQGNTESQASQMSTDGPPQGSPALDPPKSPMEQPAEGGAEAKASPEPVGQLQPESTSEEQVPQEPRAAEAAERAEDQAAPSTEPVGEPVEAPSSDDQPPSAAEPPDAARALPPVSITQAPDGRLIITSEDTAALDQLEDLISRLAPPRKEYHVFKLLYAEAYWVKWNLEDFFKEEEKSDRSSRDFDSWYFGYPSSSGSTEPSRRLSRRRPLRFISDDDTNTILVQGATPDQIRTIQELIELYDQPPSTDSDSARKTEVFLIRYSKADVVAEAVKDVYRDLLSDRDKSLAGRGPEQQRAESRYSYTYILGDEGDERKMPRWKGYLSIGIDTLSNTLIVSAPEFLFRDVERLIQDLDEAAKPSDTLHILQLGQGVSASLVQESLSKVLSEAAGKRAAKPAGERPGEGGPRPPGERRGPRTD